MNLTLYTIKALLVLDSGNGSRVIAKYYPGQAGTGSSAAAVTAGPTSPTRATAAGPGGGAPPNTTTATGPVVPSAPSTGFPSLYSIKDQKSFERRLWDKTRKQPNSEIILFENHLVVFRSVVDVTFYVVSSLDENEIMIATALHSLIEAINLVLIKHPTEKRTIQSYMDLAALAVDECIDNGVVMETDPATIASRVSKRPSEMNDISLGDPQSISDAINKAKDQLFAGVLLK